MELQTHPPDDDLERLTDVYRAMTTAWLMELRRAFVADRAAPSASAATQAFCTGRLAIIDVVLQERIV